MLSRVAENLYWMGRYVERAENTARLVLATSQQHMEAGGKAQLPWSGLLRIMGLEQYAPLAALGNEGGPAIRYLTQDEANPSSLISSLHQARENARSVREMLPVEAWESLNGLYLMARMHLREGHSDADRSQTLREVVRQRMTLSGILHESMSHDVAFLFVRLGEMLERVDMTSRIIDLTTVTPRQPESAEHLGNSADWMNVLRALGAYPMYRQHVGVQVIPESVIAFLFSDSHFPRAMQYCLNVLEESLGQLPRPDQNRGTLRALAPHLNTSGISDLETLHRHIDRLQIDLGKLHLKIHDLFFAVRKMPQPVVAEQPQQA